jgi:hypothetical protein
VVLSGVTVVEPSMATPPTPWSIEADVALLVVHASVAGSPPTTEVGLAVNESIVTLAGWLTGSTVTLTAPDVDVAPPLSVAFAVSE